MTSGENNCDILSIILAGTEPEGSSSIARSFSSTREWTHTSLSSRGQWNHSITDITAKQIQWHHNTDYYYNSFRSQFYAKCHCSVFMERRRGPAVRNCCEMRRSLQPLADYLWRCSNTIIGTLFALIAASPWKRLQGRLLELGF